MKKLILAASLMTAGTFLAPGTNGASFGDDVAFLQRHTRVIVLSDKTGQAKIAVAPEWQGRIMTSSANGDAGASFGWINRELIAAGKIQPHINVYGGEDRFWLGPEGGQFSIFFAKGAKFELSDWFTPAPIDTMPFRVVSQSPSLARFEADFAVTNFSGTEFVVKVDRAVRLLGAATAWRRLGLKPVEGANLVACESVNKITNDGREAWKKETGLLSVWILGMFNPSPAATIVVPVKAGPESDLGPKLTSNYFGVVPMERLVVKNDTIFFSADGRFRSKIGINPRRSKSVLGSYDAANKVLTIIQFSQREGVTDYVNSLWKLQDNPYSGDAANSYNDGPPSPGAKPLGPFFELESSSPAAGLAPRKSLSHTHRTIHLTGSESALDTVSKAVLGVSLADIQNALPR